ncbi:MAG TPA: serine hydrolase domain-containing protein [Turneriella sp.]|nr:serine hydrolase domain-containing protein [Turneriella sp.]
MKKSRKINSRTVCSVFALLFIFYCRGEDKLQKAFIKVDATLNRYVAENKVVGAVAVVWRDGKPFYERAVGFSDREVKVPMQMDSIFRIASMTKAITSVATLMLVEEHKLKLSDKVSEYIPEFKNMQVLVKDPVTQAVSFEPAKEEITIHQLLTHTSGLSYAWEKELGDLYRDAGLGRKLPMNWNLSVLKETICETAAKIGRLPLAAQPGGGFRYGYSTDILGCVIEKVSKKSLDKFFAERIFNPLEMHDTYFYLPKSKISRLTALYGSNKEGTAERSKSKKTYPYFEGYRTNFSGGAGLVSTALDYAHFLEMIRQGGQWKDKTLLKKSTVKLMTYSPYGEKASMPSTFTYGFDVTLYPNAKGQSAVQSYGWTGAYGTFYRIDPRQKMVIILMTQLLPNNTDIRDTFWQALYDALAEARARY